VHLDDQLGARAGKSPGGERSGSDERVGGDDCIRSVRAQQARSGGRERRVEEGCWFGQRGEAGIVPGAGDGRQDAEVELLADGVPLLREPRVERDGDAAAPDEERPGSQRAASARIASNRV
jgi:hypothetical protein